MIWDLERETKVIRLVKCLTDRVETHGWGVAFADPSLWRTRGIIYAAAGIEDWSTNEDREAAGRLRIWFWNVRKVAA